MNKIDVLIATIANGEQTSSAIPVDGGMILAVEWPAGTDSTAMTITTSADGVTYQTFYKDGADKSWTIAASKNVSIADDHVVCNWAKIVAGSAETPAKTLKITVLRMD